MKIDKAAILIKKAALEFDKIANQTLEQYDLSAAQYKVMKYIFDEYENGVRLVDLENYSSMTHPTAIGLVQNLEKKGFCEYRENPNHARSRLIYPTDKALQLQAELEKVGGDLEQQLTQRLNDDEKKELIELLRKLLGIKGDS